MDKTPQQVTIEGGVVPARSYDPALPELCYATLNTDRSQVVIIKRGETGYYPYHLFEGVSAHDVCAIVDEMNEKMGVTPLQRLCMTDGSMFGWHVPAADPEYQARKLAEKGLAPHDLYGPDAD